MQKINNILASCALLTILCTSCDEKIMGGGDPIRMGDPASIVTESDTANLKNYVRDISKKEQDAGEIARIMVQVDSVKVVEELEGLADNDSLINGFTVAFDDCSVIFNKLNAKALEEQNPETSSSVSYLVTKGKLAKVKIKITGLKNISITERIFTKLKVANDKEEYLLRTLGRKISDWFPLAGKGNIFIGAGDNSFQFNNLSNKKIALALDKELRAQNIKESKQQEWKQLIKNTSHYTDAPCQLYVSTAQFKVRGTNKKGKKVNKLIQFDIVE